MYLDYAENQAERQIPMTMKDWAAKLDAFLQFNDYNMLKDAGKLSHDVACNSPKASTRSSACSRTATTSATSTRRCGG